MSVALEAWQQALGVRVARGGSPGATGSAVDARALVGDEARWLERVVETPGFRVTCEVQRWWRDLRLRTAAPLTLACLPEACAEALLRRYLDTHLASTQFFLAEAIRFLDWLPQNAELAAAPHASAIAAWEAARLRALLADRPRAAGQCLECVQQAAGAALVPFSAPPEHVLAALVTGAALPAISADRWDVLVVPGRPPRWRVVEPAESRLIEACRAPRAVDSLRADGASDALLARLVAEGALEEAQGCAGRAGPRRGPAR